MNRPACPRCDHVLGWPVALRQVFGWSRAGTAMWGAVCPACGADLKVPNARMLLIAASGIFFGSQSSVVLLLGTPSAVVFWAAKVGLVLFCYFLAVLFIFKLEPVA